MRNFKRALLLAAAASPMPDRLAREITTRLDLDTEERLGVLIVAFTLRAAWHQWRREWIECGMMMGQATEHLRELRRLELAHVQPRKSNGLKDMN